MLILFLENIDCDIFYYYVYYGYWVNDFCVFNFCFGIVDDFKVFSKVFYDRGMYLMVDIVVNNIFGIIVNDFFSIFDFVVDGFIWIDFLEFYF